MDAISALSEWMLGIGIKVKDADKYASAFCDDGYDTVEDLATLTPSDLKARGVKKAHIGQILEEAQEVPVRLVPSLTKPDWRRWQGSSR